MSEVTTEYRIANVHIPGPQSNPSMDSGSRSEFNIKTVSSLKDAKEERLRRIENNGTKGSAIEIYAIDITGGHRDMRNLTEKESLAIGIPPKTKGIAARTEENIGNKVNREVTQEVTQDVKAQIQREVAVEARANASKMLRHTMVGTLIAGGIGAAEAHTTSNSPTLAGDVKGAFNMAAPVTSAAAQGHYAEAAMQVVEKYDLTGLISGAVRNGLHDMGADVEKGMQFAVLNGEEKRTLERNSKRLMYLMQDQHAFLQNAGLTSLEDGHGKKIDVGAILRDPERRELFTHSLEQSYLKERDPAEKDKIMTMIDACHTFVADEEKRIPLQAQINQIMTDHVKDFAEQKPAFVSNAPAPKAG
jgi:hypothetical protein